MLMKEPRQGLQSQTKFKNVKYNQTQNTPANYRLIDNSKPPWLYAGFCGTL